MQSIKQHSQEGMRHRGPLLSALTPTSGAGVQTYLSLAVAQLTPSMCMHACRSTATPTVRSWSPADWWCPGHLVQHLDFTPEGKAFIPFIATYGGKVVHSKQNSAVKKGSGKRAVRVNGMASSMFPCTRPQCKWSSITPAEALSRFKFEATGKVLLLEITNDPSAPVQVQGDTMQQTVGAKTTDYTVSHCAPSASGTDRPSMNERTAHTKHVNPLPPEITPHQDHTKKTSLAGRNGHEAIQKVRTETCQPDNVAAVVTKVVENIVTDEQMLPTASQGACPLGEAIRSAINANMDKIVDGVLEQLKDSGLSQGVVRTVTNNMSGTLHVMPTSLATSGQRANTTPGTKRPRPSDDHVEGDDGHTPVTATAASAPRPWTRVKRCIQGVMSVGVAAALFMSPMLLSSPVQDQLGLPPAL